MTVGMFLLTGLSVSTTRWQTSIDFLILGVGMGCLMQMVSLIAQNSVELKDMGVATSARMFFQQMGGSLGVAAFGLRARPVRQAGAAARPGAERDAIRRRP
jgi:hypothetical protein